MERPTFTVIPCSVLEGWWMSTWCYWTVRGYYVFGFAPCTPMNQQCMLGPWGLEWTGRTKLGAFSWSNKFTKGSRLFVSSLETWLSNLIGRGVADGLGTRPSRSGRTGTWSCAGNRTLGQPPGSSDPLEVWGVSLFMMLGMEGNGRWRPTKSAKYGVGKWRSAQPIQHTVTKQRTNLAHE